MASHGPIIKLMTSLWPYLTSESHQILVRMCARYLQLCLLNFTFTAFLVPEIFKGGTRLCPLPVPGVWTCDIAPARLIHLSTERKLKHYTADWCVLIFGKVDQIFFLCFLSKFLARSADFLRLAVYRFSYAIQHVLHLSEQRCTVETQLSRQALGLQLRTFRVLI